MAACDIPLCNYNNLVLGVARDSGESRGIRSGAGSGPGGAGREARGVRVGRWPGSGAGRGRARASAA